MHGTIVGVLRGGPSSEHETSLLTGHAIIANLPRDTYTIRDIYIDKQGNWFERGRPAVPADILRTLDVVIVALHGQYGADGEIQRLLETFNLPYTGSDSLGTRVAMHKAMAKEHAKHAGIKTPKYVLVEQDADPEAVAYEVVRSFHQPVVVKPLRGDSSYARVVGGFLEVHNAVRELLEGTDVLVEEFVRGTRASAGIVEGLRDELLYSLPPIEILENNQAVYPGRFTKQVANELMRHARTMHESLGLRHYSSSDFIVTPTDIYYLETNTLPGLTKQALFPTALDAVGVSMPEFLTHLVELAQVHT